MDQTNFLLIVSIGIVIYIIFLILGFSLREKNLLSQDLKKKK